MPDRLEHARRLIGEKVAEIGSDGAIVFDAAQVAPLLGLSPPRMLAEMRKGIVYQVSETGVGVDAGRIRVTFRYRGQQATLIIDDTGRATSFA